MDWDKLLKEANESLENRRKKSPRWRKIWRWATNCCQKCGSRLLAYDNLFNPIRVCRYCDKINPSRVISDFDLPRFNSKIWPFLGGAVILIVALWMLYSVKRTERIEKDPSEQKLQEWKVKWFPVNWRGILLYFCELRNSIKKLSSSWSASWRRRISS